MNIADHLQAVKPSYIREILSDARAEGIISLAGGLPAPNLFPQQILREAMACSAQIPGVFQYDETQGYGPLLEYCEEVYSLSSDHCALACSGSQQAIDLIARAYLNPGDGVAMEAPTYLGALQVFELQQARLESVPQLDEGPDLEALETAFASGSIKMFYAVPDFHNPTGRCWSLAARQKVAQLCIQYRVLLIEDAPYRDLRFTGKPLPLVSSFCPDQAFLLRSFSKVCAPGIRVGIVTGLRKWLAPLITIKQCSDLHSSVPMQAVLLHVLKHPEYPQHIDELRRHYSIRHQALVSALSDQLPPDYKVQAVDGGMFLWLTLPRGEPSPVAAAAMKAGVAVVPGDVFYSDPTQAQAALRLNFSYNEPEMLQEAVRRLSRVL